MIIETDPCGNQYEVTDQEIAERQADLAAARERLITRPGPRSIWDLPIAAWAWAGDAAELNA